MQAGYRDAARGALTSLGEEERFLQRTVRDFARSEIAPRVSSMDTEHAMDPALIRRLFELGLMGVEIPERFGGAGGSFFAACSWWRSSPQWTPRWPCWWTSRTRW